jgi:hypothetical protein
MTLVHFETAISTVCRKPVARPRLGRVAPLFHGPNRRQNGGR